MDIMNINGVECYEQSGTAYLKLETVARGLGFTRTAESGNEVVRWERVEKYLTELGVPTCGHDDFIPENIFYRLAMKAKNAAAEAFQAKIADEVIPSIRRTGGYIAGAESMTPDELMAKALVVAQKTIEAQAARLTAAEKENAAMRPKALFADSVSASKNSILVGELAKLLKQNGVEMGQNRLFEWMRSNGYLIRRQGCDYNMPTQRSMELGLFEIKETSVSHSDGHISVNKTPKITGRGQQYFINLFLS